MPDIEMPMGNTLHRSSKKIFIAVILSVVLFCAAILFYAIIDDRSARRIFTDIYSPVLNILATIALFMAARWSARISKRVRTAWFLFALAQLTFTLSDIIWAVLEVGMNTSPFPSIADAGYLAYYFIFLAGVFALPIKKQPLFEWFKCALDMGIVMLAAILGFWNFLIAPLIASGIENPLLTQLLSLAYPVGDVILLWAVIWLLYNQSESQNGTPILFLVFASAAMIVTDCIFSYQSLAGTYESGSLIDIGWLLTYFLTAMAGIHQAYIADPSKNAVASSVRPMNDLIRKVKGLLTYMPYIWVVLAYLFLIMENNSTLPMAFPHLAAGVGILIGMVIVRQIVALGENNRLYTRLQKMMGQIQRQTAVLEETNRELQAEILERKRAEEQLTHDALHDGLTGLPNRVLFMDRLERAIEYCRRRPDYPFSVLFLDLDQFKIINDSLGHTIGDLLLISIAHRLGASIRASDTVARLGGDEFVVLIENTSLEAAVSIVAQKIQENLKKPFTLEGHEIYISASIGIVESVINYDRPDEVLRDADIAMYHAKELGKSRFEFFSDGLRKKAVSRLELENELRQAIECQEFELHYQPIVKLATNEITSCEALIRWRHPKRGLLLPADFIQVAEESGLILPIGQWVLFEACSQLKMWQETYPRLHNLAINVNISGKQFTQPDFVKVVEQALARTGLHSEYLKLEITESVLIDNYTAANDKFQELLGIGVQLQIDDFGTGYSSLGYLQHFPVHTIKIDKSFVQEMGKGKKGSDLIRAMVSMAKDLGMDTIAEGIEIGEQLDELRSVDCQYGQGYLLSRPLDRSTFEKNMESPIQIKIPEDSTI